MDAKEQKQQGGLKRELGLPAAIAMVVGSMIGSGIFTSPQNMAAATNPKLALVAWILTGAGTFCIVLSFSHMVELMPFTGGAVVYSDAAFGRWGGFTIAWSYWACAWISQASFLTAGIRYLSSIFPIFDQNGIAAFLAGSAMLWILTVINILGVKKAGYVQVVTTICKLLPVILFILLAIFHFNAANFNTVSSPAMNDTGTLSGGAAIAMWAFLGFEMAAVPAGETKNAGKNLKNAVLYGFIFVAIIYFIVGFLASGVLPQARLAKSTAPFADMINFMTGGRWAGILVSLRSEELISVLGAANGNVIVTSRTAYAATQRRMFPDIFGEINPKFGTPVKNMVINAILTNCVLVLNCVQSLNAAFTFMILLSTLSSMPAYLMTEGAEMLFVKNKFNRITIGKFLKSSIVPLLAFLYTLYITFASGANTVMWGFILIMVGMPMFIYMKIKSKDTQIPKRDLQEMPETESGPKEKA